MYYSTYMPVISATFTPKNKLIDLADRKMTIKVIEPFIMRTLHTLLDKENAQTTILITKLVQANPAILEFLG